MNNQTDYKSLFGMIFLMLLGIGIIFHGISLYEVEYYDPTEINESIKPIYTNQSEPKPFFTIQPNLSIHESNIS